MSYDDCVSLPEPVSPLSFGANGSFGAVRVAYVSSFRFLINASLAYLEYFKRSGDDDK